MEIRQLFLGERGKRSEYRLIRRIGKGGYGETFLAQTRDKRMHVLKRVSLETIERQDMFTELEILKHLSSGGCQRGVLCYEDYFFDFSDCSFYIVTEEFEDSMELFEFSETLNMDTSIIEIVKIMSNISDSIKYLHDNGVGHNDIKLENLLINPVTLDTMIIDFGLSCMKESEQEQEQSEQENSCKWGGTYEYMAPEMLKYKLTGIKTDIDLEMIKRADIFSLGVVFWVLINRDFPYIAIDSPRQIKRGMDKNRIVIMDRQYKVQSLLNFWETNTDLKFNYTNIEEYRRTNNKIIKDIYEKLNKTVKKMLSIDPNNRPNINEIIKELNEFQITFNLEQTSKFNLPQTQVQLKNENENDNLLNRIDDLINDLRKSIDAVDTQETKSKENGSDDSEFSYGKYYGKRS